VEHASCSLIFSAPSARMSGSALRCEPDLQGLIPYDRCGSFGLVAELACPDCGGWPRIHGLELDSSPEFGSTLALDESNWQALS
jgi:hypothetical protein